MEAARGVSDVSAENLLKNQSDRTNRNAALAFVTQLTGEAADELGERSALTAAPVNQIINIIQNTATGPQTSIKATRPDTPSAPSFRFTGEIFSFCTHHNSWSRKVNIHLHVHHNQMKRSFFFI